MDPEAMPLKSVEPEPMASPSPYVVTSAPPTSLAPAIALRVGPDRMPDRPLSMTELQRPAERQHQSLAEYQRPAEHQRLAEYKRPAEYASTNEYPRANDFPARANDFPRLNDFPRANDFPPKPTEFQRAAEFQRPMQMQAPLAPSGPVDIRAVKTNCQHNLRQLIRLQQQRHSFGAGTSELEWHIRNQTGILLTDLRALQREVRDMAKAAQNHRWRKWLLGGFIATFIPAVRKLFRRGSDDESRSSSNNTEYAFKRTKGLVDRIKDTVLGSNNYAGIAFFVFAVLYVFQNEVTLRVAKTVQKRIRKLASRIEYGNGEIDEKDLKLLEGWRWRVILW